MELFRPGIKKDLSEVEKNELYPVCSVMLR